MKCFLVMVNPRLGPRYVDSAWVSKESAKERLADLVESLKASGSEVKPDSLWVWIAECRVQDARLEKPERLPKKRQKKSNETKINQ